MNLFTPKQKMERKLSGFAACFVLTKIVSYLEKNVFEIVLLIVVFCSYSAISLAFCSVSAFYLFVL